jgi:hypothetical protein
MMLLAMGKLTDKDESSLKGTVPGDFRLQEFS